MPKDFLETRSRESSHGRGAEGFELDAEVSTLIKQVENIDQQIAKKIAGYCARVNSHDPSRLVKSIDNVLKGCSTEEKYKIVLSAIALLAVNS